MHGLRNARHRALCCTIVPWIAISSCLANGCTRGEVTSRRSTQAAGHSVAPVIPSATTVPTDTDGWNVLTDAIRWRRTTVRNPDDGQLLEWLVVRLDVSRVTLAALSPPGESIAALAQDPRVLFAVDGGFFDHAHRPAGTLISRGRRIANYNPRGGSGLLLIRQGRAEVMESSTPLDEGLFIDLAVQCGPRLIERDGSVGIYRDDGHRFARTAACVRHGGRTLDFVLTWSPAHPLRGPGLYAFARMLAAPSPVGDPAGCERALNLDGGPSTGVFVRGAPMASHDSLGPVPWVIAVLTSGN